MAATSSELATFPITRTKFSRLAETDFNDLKFGKLFADHQFIMDYADGHWQNPRIEPFGPMEISPALSAIHYGQALFEGLKAYRGVDGVIRIFRPEANAARLNKSAERLCMPTIPEETIVAALHQLIELDADWVPNAIGGSLYIRPFMFATDAFVGIRPSETYRFMIFTCPVGQYYNEPVRVKVETHYSRACEGGTGFAKAAGNYAGALYPTKLAQEEGFHQLLWTDSKEHKYFEEAGTMNVVFVVKGKVITPATGSTILSGVTRDSVLKIAQSLGYEVEQRRVAVAEIKEAIENGTLEDAFGAGTAATIAPIGVMNIDGVNYELPSVENRKFSNSVKKVLEDLRYGRTVDTFGWNHLVVNN